MCSAALVLFSILVFQDGAFVRPPTKFTSAFAGLLDHRACDFYLFGVVSVQVPVFTVGPNENHGEVTYVVRPVDNNNPLFRTFEKGTFGRLVHKKLLETNILVIRGADGSITKNLLGISI